MSDRIAIFSLGRIEQIGTPAEVYERPATAFVAGFVGTSNMLAGDVAQAAHREHRDRTRSGPRRSTSRSTGAAVPTGSVAVDGLRPGRRLPRLGHPLPRDARRGRRARGHQAERDHLLDGGARAQGQARTLALGPAAHAAGRDDPAGCTNGETGPTRSEPAQRDRRRHDARPNEDMCRSWGPASRWHSRSCRRRMLAQSASPAASGFASRCCRASTCPRWAARARAQLNIIVWVGYAEDGCQPGRIRLGPRLHRTRPAAR